jgi:hypothetical protein
LSSPVLDRSQERQPIAKKGIWLALKRTTGVEPATFGLGSRRSTN